MLKIGTAKYRQKFITDKVGAVGNAVGINAVVKKEI